MSSAKVLLAIVVIAAVFHSLEGLTQGAGALVGKRDTDTMSRAKKMFLGISPFQLDRFVSFLIIDLFLCFCAIWFLQLYAYSTNSNVAQIYLKIYLKINYFY